MSVNGISARTARPAGPQSDDERGFDAASWFVLMAVVVWLGGSLALAAYQFTLPSDGWLRDATEYSGERYTFGRRLAQGTSPIRRGDVLVAVDGQPVDEMFVRALALRPERPETWDVGGVAGYTVLRDGRSLELRVPLAALPATAILPAPYLGPFGWLVILCLQAVAFFVFVQRPRNGAARLLLVFVTPLSALALPSRPSELFDRVAYWPSELYTTLAWELIIFPVLVHLLLTFPVRKGILRRSPLRTLAALYLALPVAFVAALVASDDWTRAFWGTYDRAAIPSNLAFLALAACSLGHSLLTVRDPVSRAQVRWMTFGVLVGFGGSTASYIASTFFVTDDPIRDVLGMIGTPCIAALPLSLAVAILRYRLFDIDVIIRRTLVYGALTVALAGMYLGMVTLGQWLFRSLTDRGSDLAVVASTLAIAALFQPLRRGLQRAIDRRFYRRRYDAARILAEYGASLRDEVELTALTSRMVGVVGETVQPVHTSLWLRAARGTGREVDR